MELQIKIKGLNEALATMRAAFPKDPKQQERLLNSAMRASSKGTIVAAAKSMALAGDGSGALSESIGLRAQRSSKRRQKNIAAGVEVVPVRGNRKAMAMYINHYYTARGKSAPAKLVISGIRHGHLIEFGTVKTRARPFLWPAAQSGKSAYISGFSMFLKKRIESAVRRRARR